MKSKNLIYPIAIIALLLSLNSCKKEVDPNSSGLLINSANNYQISNNILPSGNEYSMMKLILIYGTVTPYKKILDNYYIIKQSPSIINNEGC